MAPEATLTRLLYSTACSFCTFLKVFRYAIQVLSGPSDCIPTASFTRRFFTRSVVLISSLFDFKLTGWFAAVNANKKL